MATKPQQKMDARFIAIKVLLRVLKNGESLSSAIPNEISNLDERERPLLQALVYGVLRWRWQLESILKKYLKKALKAKDLDINIILMLGVFQLLWLRTPDYAAVDGAVNSSLKIRKKWAKALINAVLRQLIRERDEINYKDTLEAEFSHPQWLIDKIKYDWPEQWQQILSEANQAAPMTLRLDTRQMEVADYNELLNEVELDAEVAAHVPGALILKQPADVSRLPGFEQGLVSVQDAAAQCAAPLLQLAPQQKVLDACAAPGGKSAHILQTEPALELDAVDISESRLQRVAENLQRLGQQANLICADISQPEQWWQGQQYDRILLDAPCSASGVIRRHPDIKSLRRESDIAELVATQQQILDVLWPMLKPGGLMLYATCSIFRVENEQQMQHFLQRMTDAEEIKIAAGWGHEQKVGRQILSGEQQMDGFYYALVRKSI
ncbi:MAG: 16S rRNA (cytosine(967)-C(5))-methyltransferase RsmB [Gammaproteobacteria bacterium]|nr:16S rRNA (cytosine(967)-C(5))-methyltransferase RsmB [Gammaproteobacteria bacterium]